MLRRRQAGALAMRSQAVRALMLRYLTARPGRVHDSLLHHARGGLEVFQCFPSVSSVFSQCLFVCGPRRYISSGEYIQMSGRAGRRGKDEKGTVIVCADETLDMDTCQGLMAVSVAMTGAHTHDGAWMQPRACQALCGRAHLCLLALPGSMHGHTFKHSVAATSPSSVTYVSLAECRSCAPAQLQGKPNPLLSSFRLSYYTLLNLLKRVEGGTDSLEYVIAHSFQQFQQEAARPRVRERLCTLLSWPRA